MTVQLLFGTSVAFSFIAWAVVAALSPNSRSENYPASISHRQRVSPPSADADLGSRV
jgi:hypothetical protein